MKFCSVCGAPVELRLPPDDNRSRHVCTVCGEIHYQNPKLIVGAIPEWQDKILLCRRAIEPRHGLWTLPAGFMENGETTVEAAARETLEEANARVAIGEDIPWDTLAFRPVYFTLQHYFADRKTGAFRFRMSDLLPPVKSV
jgi:ADP-ribose pyrophosphatase YjhB (NUDIX family)